MSTTGFVLCHPQSIDLLPHKKKNKHVNILRISCGTTKIDAADLSESNDFFPTYASWNSALFETSVILTIWEHAEQLFGQNNIAILHSDITPHFDHVSIWKQTNKWLSENKKRAVGLTAPVSASHAWDDWTVPKDVKYVPSHDPMLLHSFDYNVHVWDHIKKYDYEIYSWAMDTQPRLIYSHQFACTRPAFDNLGHKLYSIVHRLQLQDIGLWTPHVFERLIALYLAQYGGEPILSTCYWHVSSSGASGPGELSLYGPRPRRYYSISTKWNKSRSAGVH